MPTDHPPLVVRHRPWAAPLRRPRMSNAEDVRPGLSLTSRHLTRDGVPLIPVSGELHFSRVPRSRWPQRLRQMRAGGVTVVSSYVFWLHHVEHQGEPRFDGNLDVAAFVDLAAEAGLDVILRIGPWCHGETRNGGFPDWVQQAPVRHRTDDPAYLAMVRDWYGQLAIALGGRCRAGGPVLALQLENELYDQPAHLVTLKRLAREAGMTAPLWVATAWGGAELPAEEVLPLYGGYGDGFWVGADAPWDPTFRDHFFFSHTWDDPGIGADVRRSQHPGPATVPPRSPSTLFPPATCELGGGMGTAYHRRPRPAALDIAAVAHCKIGNGSAWQGYYMYAGGTNPPGDHGMQESHATGYPNDLPRRGYDFHAPIGEAGTLQPSHAELRRQHAFLAAFGAELAEMPSTLPETRPSGVEDGDTLRWALRSDGESGFLFIAWHQPHVPLDTYRAARFRVVLDGDELVLPSRPVDIPPGTLARWPLRFTAGGVRLDWATASALTLLPGDVPTLVLTAEPGVEAEIALNGEVRTLTPALTPVRLTTNGAGALDVLLLDPATARTAWVCEDGGRRLLLSDDELSWGSDGRVTARCGVPSVRAYDPARRAFTELPMDPAGAVPATVGDAGVELLRAAGAAVPVAYGKHDGRQSAPAAGTFQELAAAYRLALPAWVDEDGLDVLLDIGWGGDVAELRVDGRTATDRFWDGSTWKVDLRDAGYRPGSEVTVHILPLAAGSTVHLPRDARDRLLAADGQLLALDHVRVTSLRTWHERRLS
ncbi:beta-galactosidase [Actinoplanes sp. NPDC049316]|uniref:beta-galactosidase n=1 Tax=Actinoplanes sp. NPDC049316 TaxID=3154727 RepID=UPI00341A465F